MSHFGPYTPNGLTFDFNFHHVTKIEVTAKNDCNNFSTREILLWDLDGNRVAIKCFSHDSHDLTVVLAHDPDDGDL